MRNARAKARRIGRLPQTASELRADIAREFLTSIPTEQSCRNRVVLVHAYDRDPIDEDRIRKIYEYASWCFNQPETGDKDTDPSSGVAVSFIEDIPLSQRITEDLHRWMSAETFNDCEPLFRYVLNEEEFQNLSASFHKRRKEFSTSSGA